MELKVVLIGDTSVGKTCIVKRAITGNFDEDSMPTLGASYTPKTVPFGDTTVKLQIWDTAGQERYRGMTPMYYRGAHVAIIVYAINDVNTFNEVDTWLTSLKENASPNVLLILCANKIDLDNIHVSTEKGEVKAKKICGAFFETSAKSGYGIDDLFYSIPKLYYEKNGKKQADENETPKTTDLTAKKREKKCC